MKKWLILPIVLIMIALLIIFVKNPNKETQTENVGADNKFNQEDNQHIPPDFNEYFPVEEDERDNAPADGGSGGGGSGSASGSSSGSEESSGSNCPQQPLSYSLGDFESGSTCNSFQGETCIEKIVTCSVSLKNLDNSVGGAFSIRFELTNPSIIASESDSKFVNPKETRLFQTSTLITGSEANTEISCNTNPESIPTKNAC